MDDKPGAEAERVVKAAGGRKGGIRRWLPLIAIVIVMIAAIAMGWHRHLSLETIGVHREVLRAFIEQHRIPALLAYAGVYIAVVALSLPGGLVLTVSGGLLFGAIVASIVTVFAATAGATLIFLIARSSLGHALSERAGPWLGKFRAGFANDGLSYMLFLRLVPFPFWLINLAPAVLGVPLRTYVLGTFIGIIPGTVAFAFLGDTLDQVIASAKTSHEACVAAKAAEVCRLTINKSDLPIAQILVALALIGIVALIPVLLKKWSRRHAAA